MVKESLYSNSKDPMQLLNDLNIIEMLKIIRSKILEAESKNHRDKYASEYIGMAIILLESKAYTDANDYLIDNVNLTKKTHNHEIIN